jgi:NAD(P)-dependent dehydrogenase (short-subunit alcohol dehydrogenase family)
VALIQLPGEIAVVTGAAQGIGEAIARTLAGAGASVAVTDLGEAAAAKVAASLGEGHAHPASRLPGHAS